MTDQHDVTDVTDISQNGEQPTAPINPITIPGAPQSVVHAGPPPAPEQHPSNPDAYVGEQPEGAHPQAVPAPAPIPAPVEQPAPVEPPAASVPTPPVVAGVTIADAGAVEPGTTTVDMQPGPSIDFAAVLEEPERVDLVVVPANTYVSNVRLLVPISSVVVDTLRTVFKTIADRTTSDGHVFDEQDNPIPWFRFGVDSVDVAGNSEHYLRLDVDPFRCTCDQGWLTCSDMGTIILNAAQTAIGLIDDIAHSRNLFVPPVVLHALSDSDAVTVASIDIRGKIGLPYRNGAVANHLQRAARALQHELVYESGTVTPTQFTGWFPVTVGRSDEILTLRKIVNRSSYKDIAFVAPANAGDPTATLEVVLTAHSSYLKARSGSTASVSVADVVDGWQPVFDDRSAATAIEDAIRESGITSAIGFHNVFTWEEQCQGPFLTMTKETLRNRSKEAARRYVATIKATRSLIIDWTNSPVTLSPKIDSYSTQLLSLYGFDFSRPPAFYACVIDFYLQRPRSVDDVVSALIANSTDGLPRVRQFSPCSSRAFELAQRLSAVQYRDDVADDFDDPEGSFAAESEDHSEQPVQQSASVKDDLSRTIVAPVVQAPVPSVSPADSEWLFD